MELGERKLDFYCLQNSFSARLNPAENLILRKTHGSAGAEAPSREIPANHLTAGSRLHRR
jgi:hypothetical protein